MGGAAFSRGFQFSLRLHSHHHLTLPWLRTIGGVDLTGTVVNCSSQRSGFSTAARVESPHVPLSVARLRKQGPREEELCNGGVLEHPATVCDNASEKRLTEAASLPKKRIRKHVLGDTDAEHPTSVRRNASGNNRQLKAFSLDENSSCEESEINEKEISKNLLEDAENVAIKLLAGRAFTVAELRKKLHGKKFPVQVVDKVIADIKDRGLVNDGLYAESFAQSKWISGTWGPRRMKQALMQKGVSEAEANKATRKVFEDNDGTSDRNFAVGYHNQENVDLHESESNNIQLIMSDSSMDHLFVQASKQWLRGQDLSTESRKARVIRWLQYRGFNWGVITVILRRLQSQFANIQDDDNINIKKNNGGGSRGNKSVQASTSEESMEKLFVEVSKQWIKGKDTSVENRKARITRWLLYRSHSWEVVKVILKRLQSQ